MGKANNAIESLDKKNKAIVMQFVSKFTSKNTKYCYSSDLANFIAHAAEMSTELNSPNDALVVKAYQSFADNMAEPLVKQSTKIRRLAVIRSYYMSVGRLGLVDELKLSLPILKIKNRRQGWVEPEIVDKVLNHPGPGKRQKALIAFIAYTGFTATAAVTANLSILEELDKNNYVNADALELVRTYVGPLKARGDHKALFISQYNRRLSRSAIWLDFRNAAIVAGVPIDTFTPQSVRASFAIRLRNACVPVLTIAKLMKVSTETVAIILLSRKELNAT